MKCVVVYNKKSGSSLQSSEIRQKFDDANITIIKLIALSDSLKQDLKPYIEAHEIIAAIGGDGTISSVTQHLVGTAAILAPLPGGTLNHFAKDAGVPNDIDEALSRLKRNKKRQVDVAKVNDIVFINNSSVGLYPSSLEIRERVEDSIGKWPAAFVGVLRSLISFHKYRFTIDGKSFTSPFIFVGNNHYNITDFGASDRTALDAGVLSVYIIRAKNRRQLISLFGHASIGKLHSSNDFKEIIVKNELVIQSSRRHLNVSHDGEINRIKCPVTYNLLAKQLWII